MIKAKDMKSFLDYSKAVFSLFLYLYILIKLILLIYTKIFNLGWNHIQIHLIQFQKNLNFRI